MWVRFPSPAPLSRRAETASANSSRSTSYEPCHGRVVLPGPRSCPALAAEARRHTAAIGMSRPLLARALHECYKSNTPYAMQEPAHG
jgi:hypothetical protein